jgi:hypothetical protein
VKWLAALIEAHKLELAELRLLRRETIATLIDEDYQPAQLARQLRISRELLYRELRRTGREPPEADL